MNAGAALTCEQVDIQMICDGHHLADETVRLLWSAARERVALVTDATAAAPGGRGTYRLGEIEIEVNGTVARRAGADRAAL